MLEARSAVQRVVKLLCLTTGVTILAVPSACSGSGFTYVENKETNTYFKIPDEWEVLDQNEVLGTLFRSPSPSTIGGIERTLWAVGFDADDEPSATHILQSTADHPAGYARVRALSEGEREGISLRALQDVGAVPITSLQQQSSTSVREVETEDIVLEGGTHGRRAVYDVRLGLGTLTYSQTALVDPATEKLYVFLIGCSASCYRTNQDMIEEVAASWTIKES